MITEDTGVERPVYVAIWSFLYLSYKLEALSRDDDIH